MYPPYGYPPYAPQTPVVFLPGHPPQEVGSLREVKALLKLIKKEEELKKKDGDKKKDDKPKAPMFTLGQVMLILGGLAPIVGPLVAVMYYNMFKWMVASIPALQ